MKTEEKQPEMTTAEMVKRTGIPKSTLQYYERKKLLVPHRTAGNNYRRYTEADVEQLKKIVLLRKFDFSIEEIRSLLARPDFDLKQTVAEQAEIQKQRAEHARSLAGFAEAVHITGVLPDTLQDIEQAEQRWNLYQAFRHCREEIANFQAAGFSVFNAVIAEFAAQRGSAPDSEAVQALADRLYRALCSYFAELPISGYRLFSHVFAAKGLAAKDVDRRNGSGTAALMGEAIRIYCDRQDDTRSKP